MKKKYLTGQLTGMFIAAGLTLTIASQANALEFNVDYFQVTGNTVGNRIDQFDGSGLLNWIVDNGTVIESGGKAIIKSPGDISVVSIGGCTMTHEESEIDTIDNSVFRISIGSGDATALSKWLPSAIPGTNEIYRMGADVNFFDASFNYIGEDYFISAIINAETSFADLYGIDTGLNFVFERRSVGLAGEITRNIQYAPISISPTDDILLRLLYDDASNQFSAAYSLDGGINFQSPFTPFGISSLGSVAIFDDWDLGGNFFSPSPAPVPKPATVLIPCISGLLLSVTDSDCTSNDSKSTERPQESGNDGDE